MNQQTKEQLLERNRRIIAAVKAKAARDCPGAVDLIAVAGSFCSGDYHEKSDLDLLIVINDDKGWKVGSCFILGDVAHDIYCTGWENLEHAALYTDPYIIKLMNVEMVYSTKESLARYNDLRAQVQARLAEPLNTADMQNIRGYFDSALKEFARLTLSGDTPACKYYSARMLYDLEFVLYMLNKTYIKRGISHIPAELCGLSLLPKNFGVLYNAVIAAADTQSVRDSSAALLQAVEALLTETEKGLKAKQPVTPQSLTGTYEEIYSNWKNKMTRAANTGDAYLSLMTTTSCQNFYDMMFNTYEIEHYDLFKAFSIDDLYRSEESFNTQMERYKALYTKTGTPVRSYENIDDFLKDYLK